MSSNLSTFASTAAGLRRHTGNQSISCCARFENFSNRVPLSFEWLLSPESIKERHVANFTLLFEGLMAFVGPSATDKTHVAVVDEPTMHGSPTLYVNGTLTDVLQKGDTITFDLPSGSVTDHTFDARIPALLSYVKGGNLDTNVKTATHPHAGVLTFIHLPAGTLFAEGRLSSPAKFTKNDDTTEIRCPAPQVRLKVSASQDGLTMTIDGPSRPRPETHTIGDGGIIGFSNTSTVPGMHFHDYVKLLTAGSMIGPIVPVNGSCTLDGQVKEGHPWRARPDASMSAAEIFAAFRSPQGDCGPTGVP